MRDGLAAHLTDHVLPYLPVRQWVLSVPKRLRPYLHHNPELVGAVLGMFLRAIRTTLRRASPRRSSEAQLGAGSFLHRFGSAPFHEDADLLPDHWLELQHIVQRRLLRHFHTHGLVDNGPSTPLRRPAGGRRGAGEA